MSKPDKPAQPANKQPQTERIKQHQTARVPGAPASPFLTSPANFGSTLSREELDKKQEGQIVPLPPPKRTPPVMELAEVVGSQYVEQIQQNGQLVFHCVGDTGFGSPWDVEAVAQVMAMDLHRPNPADHPAFFFHLGDVVYNTQYSTPESKSKMYQPQFYMPYDQYTGKILAIPGNHDSNPQEDPQSIDAFQDNFCAAPPATIAGLTAALQSPNRPPMYQPGVYYRLDAPFAQIIALFSNGGETQGVIRGGTGGAIQGGIVGDDQWNFLVAQLKVVKAARDAAGTAPRAALIVAMHHPPYSGGGGHSGSSFMLADMDAAFQAAGIAPDAVLSGHAHVYQRFTRLVPFGGKTMEVPYIVAGNGGHGPIQPVKPSFERTPVKTPLQGVSADGSSDHSLRQYFNGFGHLMITVTNRVLTIDLIGTHTQTHQSVDSVTVNLATNKIIHETPSFDHPAAGEVSSAHPKK
jgi:hypothetical protein